MKKAENFKESFGYAKEGFLHCLTHERNFRVHLIFGLLAMALSVLLSVSLTEFAVILLLIAVVLFAEMVNTAMENLVDLVTPAYHPLAKIIKDVAAGAVLLLCFMAVLIGIVIFLPHIISIFN